jgi:hypothetical protein
MHIALSLHPRVPLSKKSADPQLLAGSPAAESPTMHIEPSLVKIHSKPGSPVPALGEEICEAVHEPLERIGAGLHAESPALVDQVGSWLKDDASVAKYSAHRHHYRVHT